MQRKILAVIAALGVIVSSAFTAEANAQNSDTQTVTFEVQAINSLAVSADPGTLTINAAVAGSAPTLVSDNSTTYAVTTNEAGKKITAAINAAMPSGVTLSVTLAAPTGGTSAGAVSLSATDQDAVTGISTLNESGLGITYGLAATAAAGVVAQDTRTVTLTLVTPV